MDRSIEDSFQEQLFIPRNLMIARCSCQHLNGTCKPTQFSKCQNVTVKYQYYFLHTGEQGLYLNFTLLLPSLNYLRGRQNTQEVNCGNQPTILISIFQLLETPTVVTSPRSQLLVPQDDEVQEQEKVAF